MAVIEAEGDLLDQILASTYTVWHEGLTTAAYRRLYLAQRRTPWGQRHLQRLALVENGALRASAKQYEFSAMLDGRTVRVLGIGAVFTEPAYRRHGHAHRLIQHMLDQARDSGVDFALLFSEIGPAYYERFGFQRLPLEDSIIRVVESTRYGAPATLVRSGEERDLSDIAAMNEVRAREHRFHLVRDRELVQFALTRKRLLAGLAPLGLREFQFFIAEEGASAVAYVALTASHRGWTLEECGDRDPTGARVGAILQVLVAREPSMARAAIRGFLPPRFAPPQLIVSREGATASGAMASGATASGPPASAGVAPVEVMMMCALQPGASPLVLSRDDILFWRSDVF